MTPGCSTSRAVRAVLREAEEIKEAAKIGKGVLGMLHLRNMPSELEVALATVYFLSRSCRVRRNVPAVRWPASGAHDHRARTVRSRQAGARGAHARADHLAGGRVSRVAPGARRAPGARVRARGTRHAAHPHRAAAEQIKDLLRIVLGNERIHTIVVGDDLEGGMDEALRVGGAPAAVVSTPFTPLPRRSSARTARPRSMRPASRRSSRPTLRTISASPARSRCSMMYASCWLPRMCRCTPRTPSSRWPTS
jgi:hypothetical protein